MNVSTDTNFILLFQMVLTITTAVQLPARLGGRAVRCPGEAEIHISSERVVVLVLVELFRQKFRRERDQKRLKTQSNRYFCSAVLITFIQRLILPCA